VILSTSVAVGESVKGRTSMARLIPQMMFLFAVASMTVASRAGASQKVSNNSNGSSTTEQEGL